MSERLLQYREKFLEKWNQLGKRQKLIIVASLLAVFLTFGLYLYISSQPNYVSLYNTRLSEQEIGTIKQELESRQIPYRITGNGTQIEVPQQMAQEIVVDLAAQGIPSQSGINAQIFSSTGSLGITDRQFDALKKDALQLELKNMLEKVRGVRSAQVLVTLPEESVFITESDDQASASITVETEPGLRLSQEQIRALYYLVSRSVKNLPIENITITDQYLNPLVLEDEKSNSLTEYDKQQEIKRKVERDIQQNVYNLLGTILGRDRVIVQTSVQIDFSQVTQKENLVTPVDEENKEGITISSQKRSKTFSGEGAPPGGIAGTNQGDTPQYPADQQGGKSEYEEVEETVNKEVNRIQRDIVESPYKIVDLAINVGVEPEEGQQQLDQQTLDAIRQALRSVVQVNINKPSQEITPEFLDQRITILPRTFSGKVAAENTPWYEQWWFLLGLGVLLLAAIGATAFVLVRRRNKEKEEEDQALADVSPTQMEVPDLQYKEDADDVIVRKQLEKLARSKPDEFVTLLRTWLAED